MRAIVLLSGGLDSTVCLAKAVKEHGAEHVAGIFVAYNQAATAQERAASSRAAERLGCGWSEVDATGLLAMSGIMEPGGDPVVYGRNLALFAIAASHAQAAGACEVWAGCCNDDAATFRDCREGFLTAAGDALYRGYELRLRVPLMRATKRLIVRWADDLGVDIGATWSCYAPSEAGEACGICDACVVSSSLRNEPC